MEEQKSQSPNTLITWHGGSAASKHSRGSSASSAAAMAFAEAEEAKAKVKYAEKEMQIKMQKAHLDAKKVYIDAQLDVLNAEKTAAAAVAKAEALAAALACDSESNCEMKSNAGHGSHHSGQQTNEYV